MFKRKLLLVGGNFSFIEITSISDDRNTTTQDYLKALKHLNDKNVYLFY